MHFRTATFADIEQMHRIRMSVHQNKLSHPDRITPKDYETFLNDKGKGWVCETEGQLVGFSVIDLADKNIWALFVLPQYEGKGIGHKLHEIMLDWYFAEQEQTLWLSTEKNTRAEAFYKQHGWKEVGLYGTVENKFEMSLEDWNNRKKKA